MPYRARECEASEDVMRGEEELRPAEELRPCLLQLDEARESVRPKDLGEGEREGGRAGEDEWRVRGSRLVRPL